MYQAYPNFYQPAQTAQRPSSTAQAPQQIPIQQPSFLKGRLVASVDEVRATPIDFDGSVFFFPDLANKKIYTKQINLDGTASLNMYELKNIPVPAVETNPAYITREEFDSTMSQIKNILNEMTNSDSTTQVVQTNQSTPSKEQPVFKF